MVLVLAVLCKKVQCLDLLGFMSCLLAAEGKIDGMEGREKKKV